MQIKYNIPDQRIIGKRSDRNPDMMIPNENFLKYFGDVELPDKKRNANRSSCLRIGTFLVQEHQELPEEHKDIIAGWKRFRRGGVIMERHLKSGTMMISMEDENAYKVVGIITSIEEMFYYAPTPLMVEATLMPFKNVIITDGLIMPYNLMIGGNMTKTFKDVYMDAKRLGTIQKSL